MGTTRKLSAMLRGKTNDSRRIIIPRGWKRRFKASKDDDA